MAMGNLPPFEDRGAYGGFFPALFQTWVAACFRPTEFFDSVGNSQDLSPALLFGVLVGWVSVILGSLWSLVLQAPLLPMMKQEEMAAQFFGTVGSLLCFGLFGWLFVLLGILINGLIIHLFLLIFGGANQGLTMTLRVISYAYAPQIFSIVPFVGWCIAPIWSLVLHIIGLAAAHRTDTWRAVLAVLVPIILCICVVGIFYGAIIAALFAGAQQKPIP
ncbi:MAG: YIP1 family protein [Armatimonadetes bacterium]|nr:YIP1 family protein [Armatimonadota bacterium]